MIYVLRNKPSHYKGVIFLVQNEISHIENLESLTELRFLSLSYNRITELSNLSCLHKLGLLDLSYNQLEEIDTGKLPTPVVTVNRSTQVCYLHLYLL